MDKVQFYNILNIDNADEFQYYENVEALLEEELLIERNLIYDLFKYIDIELLSTSIDTYFENFLNVLPDNETDLYIVVNSIKEEIHNKIDEAESGDMHSLADALYKFRKWYVMDKLVLDKNDNVDISIRDARYNIQAAKLLGEEYSYDFSKALDYGLEGIDYKVSDLINNFN